MCTYFCPENLRQKWGCIENNNMIFLKGLIQSSCTCRAKCVPSQAWWDRGLKCKQSFSILSVREMQQWLPPLGLILKKIIPSMFLRKCSSCFQKFYVSYCSAPNFFCKADCLDESIPYVPGAQHPSLRLACIKFSKGCN